ncbi:MAG: ABC transporter substrate-binding protein [Fimbriimonadaceae bacterium]|nr:ABC transporter substrate-binding protein [Fimbriimonadaceae bacterium]
MKGGNIWLGLALTAVVVSVAETERVSRPKTYPGRVLVTCWSGWTDFEADAMRRVIDNFNRRQDKVHVEYLSVSGIEEKTMLATAAGVPPDLAGIAGANVPLYAYYHALTPLDGMCAEAGIKRSDYIPACFDLCTYKGTVYSLPATPATTALHYNRAVLREAGWDPDRPPRTFSELDRMDEMVMRKDSDGHVTRAGFLPTEPGWWPWSWPYFFGGTLMDKAGRITTDLPENVRAFTWMQSFARRYGSSQMQSFRQGFGQFNSPRNAFIDGSVATVMQGVWMANFIQKYNPKLDWAAAPFPHPDDRPDLAGRVIVEQDIVAIPRGAKHPREAFEFLKYLQSQEGMETLCLGQKKFSPLLKVSPDFYAKHPNPYIKLFRDQALSHNAFFTPRTPVWNEYQRELQNAIDKMNLLDPTPPKTLLAQVRERVQHLQDEVDHVDALRAKQGG